MSAHGSSPTKTTTVTIPSALHSRLEKAKVIEEEPLWKVIERALDSLPEKTGRSA
jgi:hypothetical protein